MQKSETPPPAAKAKLSDFVENNQKFISVLGIFTALAAFSNNLADKELGYLLAFPSLSVVLLLWVELLRKSSLDPEKVELPLFFFQGCIAMIVFIVFYIWFRDYYKFLRPLLSTIIWVALLCLFASPAEKIIQRVWRNPVIVRLSKQGRLAKLLPVIITIPPYLYVMWVLTAIICVLFMSKLDRMADYSEVASETNAPSANPAITSQLQSNAAQQEHQRSVNEARRLESEADVLLRVDATRGEHSVRLVRPALPGFTNELSTAAEFQALATALPKHDTAVIQMWAMGWNTNRVTNAVSHLRHAGFHSIRAVAMRWGQSTPGPEL
jgi:hypothetical protein